MWRGYRASVWRMSYPRAALLAVLGLLLVPSAALANHHACPQVTTSGPNVDVSRRDCSPVYVPYPIGGPKSPLPAGANVNLPLPNSLLKFLPPLKTPYPNTAGNDNPPDPLGCSGPDLSFVNRGVLAPILGKPRNSDPADPYNCSGRSVFILKVPKQGVWRARLLDVDRGGLVLQPIRGTATVKVSAKVKFQTPSSVKTGPWPKGLKLPTILPPTILPPGVPILSGLGPLPVLPPVTVPPVVPPVTVPPVVPPVVPQPVALPPLPSPPVPPVSIPPVVTPPRLPPVVIPPVCIPLPLTPCP